MHCDDPEWFAWCLRISRGKGCILSGGNAHPISLQRASADSLSACHFALAGEPVENAAAFVGRFQNSLSVSDVRQGQYCLSSGRATVSMTRVTARESTSHAPSSSWTASLECRRFWLTCELIPAGQEREITCQLRFDRTSELPRIVYPPFDLSIYQRTLNGEFIY